MDKFHSILLSARLDKKWWPEILLTVNYLRNLSPSSVIGKTPYEAWYGEKPDLFHLRIIGCTAYTKKVESEQRKLADKKAFPCKLLRYDGDRIYRLLTHDNGILRSTNVEFVKKARSNTHTQTISPPPDQTPQEQTIVWIHAEKCQGPTNRRGLNAVIALSKGRRYLGSSPMTTFLSLNYQ